jgi:hypothetical protein
MQAIVLASKMTYIDGIQQIIIKLQNAKSPPQPAQLYNLTLLHDSWQHTFFGADRSCLMLDAWVNE